MVSNYDLKIAEDIGEIKTSLKNLINQIEGIRIDQELKRQSIIETQREHAKDIKKLTGWRNKIIGAGLTLQGIWSGLVVYFNGK